MLETKAKEEVHPANSEPYHGPERRKPENEQFRLAVEAKLIADKRIKERETAGAQATAKDKNKERKSLLNW
jgi:hypothetical protein